MVMEDNELTFIRCPSCRSLIPAVANRCRMCGHKLEDAEVGADTASVPSSSQEENSLESFSSPPPTSYDETSTSEVNPADNSSIVNEDKESQSASATGVFPESSTLEKSASDSNLIDSADAPTVASVSSAMAGEVFGQTEDGNHPKSTKVSGSREGLSGLSESSEDSGETAPKKKRKRKRKKKPSNSQAENRTEASSGPFIGQETRSDGEVEIISGEGIQDDGKAKMREVSNEQNQKRSVLSVPSLDGDLVGWIVCIGSGSDLPEYVEVREGKFFISSERIKDTDFVVESKGIAAPHCIVKATAGEGLVIQDLMTEKGVKLRRLKSGRYESLSSSATVSHGDQVKLGEQEFLVCLRPSLADSKSGKKAKESKSEEKDLRSEE